MKDLILATVAILIMVYISQIMYTAPLTTTLPLVLVCAGLLGYAMRGGPFNPNNRR